MKKRVFLLNQIENVFKTAGSLVLVVGSALRSTNLASRTSKEFRPWIIISHVEVKFTEQMAL